MAAPTLTAVSPASAEAGKATTVVLTGTGLGTALVPAVTASGGCTVGTVTGLAGTSISFTLTPPVGAPAGVAPTLTVKTRHTISNVVLTSNVVTVTVESGHSIMVGDSVAVVAVTNTAINGTFTVTAADATTFSYALTHANITTGADTGTVVDNTAVTHAGPVLRPGGASTQPYYNTIPGTVLAADSAVGQTTETSVDVENPLNGKVLSSATANSQSAKQWTDNGSGLQPAEPVAATNPAVAMDSRLQETDLSGVGLGDYVQQHAYSFPLVNKVLTSNVATLTTAQAHGFTVGQVVTVAGIDSIFNGAFTITAVTSTTFSYAKTHADVGTAAITAGTVTGTFADRPSRIPAPSVG
jgi:hypothetical protein